MWGNRGPSNHYEEKFLLARSVVRSAGGEKRLCPGHRRRNRRCAANDKRRSQLLAYVRSYDPGSVVMKVRQKARLQSSCLERAGECMLRVPPAMFWLTAPAAPKNLGKCCPGVLHVVQRRR